MDDPPHPTDQEPDAHKASARRDATIVLAILGILLAVALIAVTTVGFGPYEATAGEARPPTLWDWLQLLVVPAVLALGALWFNKSQKDTELRIAHQARRSEQQIAGDRLGQATLEAYYDRMTDLLLTHNLREAEAEAEERSIARARTVAVARGLDGGRKAQLLAFLMTSGLIGKDKTIIDLRGVDFSGAILREANLREANLSRANLSGADLRRADLSAANLIAANLSGANLSAAHLSAAYLCVAGLGEADLSGADLCEADLREANLSGANLSRTSLSGANLRQANLRGANLSGAYLNEADLHRAELDEADLHRAELGEANMSGATGWTIAQLEQATVTGSTMPDGKRLARKATQFSNAIRGTTFEKWKARYLAGQETGGDETGQGASGDG